MARLTIVLLVILVIIGTASAKQQIQHSAEAHANGKGKYSDSAPGSSFAPEFSNENPTYAIDHYTYNVYDYSQPADFWTIVVAVATIVLAVASLALWWTSCKQWRAIERQAGIAEATLTSMARPRLVVRYVRKHLCEPEKQIEVIYTVVNIGGLPAQVIESNFAICDLPDLPPMPPYKDAGILGVCKIPSGAWMNGHCVSKEILSRDRFKLLYDQTRVFFFGYILYSDELGRTRHYTVVCREWNPSQTNLGAFIPVASQDHENAD